MTQNRMFVSKLIFAVAIGLSVFTACKKYEGESSDSISSERWRRPRTGGGSGSGADTITTTPGTGAGTINTTTGPTFTFSQLTSDYSRPGAGSERWLSNWQINIPNVSPLDEYYRFTWNQFEKDNGQYDFNDLYNRIKRAVDAGCKYNFGIMTYFPGAQVGWDGIISCDGGNSAYPVYLHNLMKAESTKDAKIGSSWMPNWNSESYISGWERLNKSIYNYLNSTTYKGLKLKEYIGYIDIRGYGEWGEWHLWNTSTSIKATPSSLLRIAKAVANGLPDIQLVSMSDGFVNGGNNNVTAEVTYYLLSGSNQLSQFGWRKDHWGSDNLNNEGGKFENNNTVYNGQRFADLIMNKWKYAPIVGEPSLSSTYNNLTTDITRYHATSFGNGNYGSVISSNVVSASKAAGARITLAGGNVSASTGGISVTLNWSNTGIAAVYENWDVVFELKNGTSVVKTLASSFKPKLFLPGSKSVTDNFTSIPAGTYTLTIKLVDPNGFRKPYPLGISGRSTDGSYTLNTVTIK